MLLYKKALFFFGLFSTTLVLTNAQVFKGEIIGGFNISQVDGNKQIGYRKASAHAGTGVVFPFKQGVKPRSVSMEILLNQKSTRKKNPYYNSENVNPDISKGKIKYLLQLNYVFEYSVIPLRTHSFHTLVKTRKQYNNSVIFYYAKRKENGREEKETRN